MLYIETPVQIITMNTNLIKNIAALADKVGDVSFFEQKQRDKPLYRYVIVDGAFKPVWEGRWIPECLTGIDVWSDGKFLI